MKQLQKSSKAELFMQPPEMVNEAVQVALSGTTLAQLLAGESEGRATPPADTTRPSSESSSNSSRFKKLRAATKLIGLNNCSKRNFIKVLPPATASTDVWLCAVSETFN